MATKKTRPPGSGTHVERIRRERGAGKSTPPAVTEQDSDFGYDFLTPDEVRQWAQREMREAARALDLRARELFDLVDAYSSGRITPEKADELQSRYDHRWGEPFPGVVQGDIGDPPLTDERIIALMDERNPTPFYTPREIHEAHVEGRRLSAKKDTDPKTR